MRVTSHGTRTCRREGSPIVDVRELTAGQLLDGLLDSTPNAAVVTDAAGVIVRTNQRFLDMWGIEPAAVCVGAVFADVVGARADLLVDASLVAPDRIGRCGDDVPSELAFLDGRIINLVCSAMRTSSGDRVGTAWFFRDVTELAHAWRERDDMQRAQQQAQARLTFLSNASASLAATLDVDATLQRAAELSVPCLADWCSTWLVAADGSLEPAWSSHHDADRLPLLRQLAERVPMAQSEVLGAADALSSGVAQYVDGISPGQIIDWAPDQTSATLLQAIGVRAVVVQPLLVRGRPIGVLVLGVGDTRTEFDDGDRALVAQLGDRVAVAVDNALMYRETEERAHAAEVIAHIGDGVVLTDAAGRIRLCNAAAGMITGVRARDVIGRDIDESLPGWSHIRWRIPVASSPDPALHRAETLPLVEGDHVTWITASAVAVPDGIVYAFRDVTAEREVEQMRSDFVATVSHELRTPLASVYGAALTLQRQDVQLDEHVRQQLLTIIASESHRLGTIVGDILTASHLDSGRVQLVREEFDLVQLVQGAVDAITPRLLATQSLRINTRSGDAGVDAAGSGDGASGGEPTISMVGDHERIRQVILNLVENAVKYSPDGGEVIVGVEQLHDDTVHLWVEDRGLGIPTRELGRIFEKFHRLDPQHTRGVGGTGLGLYISRELVARMGGTMRVESELGHGSTFHVVLPLVLT